ncbi:MAG TPA: c-type cytochrome [Gemmatimonadaceae bacterium]
MTAARARAVVAIGLGALAAATGCEREARPFRSTALTASAPGEVTVSVLQPGPRAPRPEMAEGPYDENAYAIADGKRLFDAYNCSGCHSQGGGGMGPPLMDSTWIYGSAPENIYATIMEGRPNGMPAWQGKIPSDQVWRLVSYVRSLAGLTRKDVRPGRNDDMQVKPAESSMPRQRAIPSTKP